MKKILFINILIIMFISSVFLISCTNKQNVKNSFSETESINIASEYLKQNTDFKTYFGKNIELVSSEKLSCDSCFKIILSYEKLSSKEAGAIDKTKATIIVENGQVKDFQIDEPVQIANPASVFCEEQGGKLELKTNDQGTYGICKFNDGSECEEWAFFRGECSKGQKIISNNETNKSSEKTYCTEEQQQAKFCTTEYMPVCGFKEVECVKAPCPPIKKTYSNKCGACLAGSDYWIEGDCLNQ